MVGRRVLILGVMLGAAGAGYALWVAVSRQTPDQLLQTADMVGRQFLVAADVDYRQVGDWAGRVDIYRPRGAGPFPVVLFFHGGGWMTGSKTHVAFWAVPFLGAGYAVVAVGYRLADEAPAPAAVEDGRCALAWIGAHGAQYKLDTSRVITAGDSAGGHLALMAGLVNGSDEFDRSCETAPAPVRAIVNIYGVTDVVDLLGGESAGPAIPEDWPFAVVWMGKAPDRVKRARRVSPLTWIDAHDPPVFSVHGTADPTVPYRHALLLHAALATAGVTNELVPLQARGHGDFTFAEWAEVMRRMLSFLKRAQQPGR
jgi:acetyl esterase/lipase